MKSLLTTLLLFTLTFLVINPANAKKCLQGYWYWEWETWEWSYKCLTYEKPEANDTHNKYYPKKLHSKIVNGTIENGELIEELFELSLKKHTKRGMSYREARKYMFGKIHLRSDSDGYYVEDVYCQRKHRKSDGVGAMKIPNHNVINCEHTWPQSRFSKKFSKSTQKTDLHHLYPTNSKANSLRGNHIFGKISGNKISWCKTSSFGREITDSKTAFMPPRKHRGNVARALFYFSIRYKIAISSSEERYLRKWHREDPVDRRERKRNDTVMKIQGNRNPFIDYPDLIKQVTNF